MFIPIQFHSSTLPHEQRKILHRSLTSKIIDSRLHYETAEQSYKWLQIHKKYSPIARVSDTIQKYKAAFEHAANENDTSSVLVVSIGCGGGNKDALLLKKLSRKAKQVQYVPTDISSSLTLQALEQAYCSILSHDCFPVVIDLNSIANLEILIRKSPQNRIFLFLGMLPNIDPDKSSKILRKLLKSGDTLITSANLSSGENYEKGIHRVLPQYDNRETREWLVTLLRDLGLFCGMNCLSFRINNAPGTSGLKRIEAIYRFSKAVRIQLDDKYYLFRRGESLTLFFSNRHTLRLAQDWMKQFGMDRVSTWINSSGEEGIFLGRVI